MPVPAQRCQRGGMPAPVPERCRRPVSGLGERGARLSEETHSLYLGEGGRERGEGFVELVATTSRPQLSLVFVTTSVPVCLRRIRAAPVPGLP